MVECLREQCEHRSRRYESKMRNIKAASPLSHCILTVLIAAGCGENDGTRAALVVRDSAGISGGNPVAASDRERRLLPVLPADQLYAGHRIRAPGSVAYRVNPKMM